VPPVAARKDHTVTAPFGASRVDPYYWLNEKENPEVIAYLDAANTTSALTRILNFYPVYELPRVRSSLAAVLRTVLVRHLLPDVAHVGNVAATELLVVDDPVREVVRNGELSDISLLLRTEGGRSGYGLDRSLLDLLTNGRVRMDDVFARAEEKAWLLERTRDLQPNPR
jgi:Tfp pilus assembly pilus retraction ATPase PilT